jgi:hypothetical protein
VFYTWKGKPVIRCHPGFIKQTRATKNAARMFGKASAISRVIREALKEILPDCKDISMRLRLNASILATLRANGSEPVGRISSLIESFEFNENYRLVSRLKKYPTTEWSENEKLTIHIPEWNVLHDIQVPVGTTKVYVCIILTGCCMDEIKPIKLQEKMIVVDYVDHIIPAQIIDWHFEKGNSLVIPVVSLRYEADGRMNEDVRWRPVGVVGSKFPR